MFQAILLFRLRPILPPMSMLSLNLYIFLQQFQLALRIYSMSLFTNIIFHVADVRANGFYLIWISSIYSMALCY